MVAKTKQTNTLRLPKDNPEWVATLAKDAALHKQIQEADSALTARLLELESGESTRDPIGDAAVALLTGKQTEGPRVEDLQKTLEVLRRAKQMHESELFSLQARVSAEVMEAWQEEFSSMLHTIGDHLAQARAAYLELAETGETLARAGVVRKAIPQPAFVDAPHLFAQLRRFNHEAWNAQLKQFGY